MPTANEGSHLSQSLVERSRRLVVLLESFVSSGAATPLERAVLYLVQHQSPEGYWSAPDYPQWTDVVTALAVRLFGRLGFDESSAWEVVGAGGKSHLGGIRPALKTLVDHQTSRGTWGEDFFDTCTVLDVLVRHRSDPPVARAIADALVYVREAIESEFPTEKDGEWFGPGFLAAAIPMLTQIDEQPLSTKALEKLYSSQRADGSFTWRADSNMDLTVWHTSLASLAMATLSVPSDEGRLSAACDWLVSAQDADGGWANGLVITRAIFTAYGAIALTRARGADNDNVIRALRWLQEHQLSDGRVGGLEGTVMAALAFTEASMERLTRSVPLNTVVDVQAMLRETGSAITQLDGNLRSIREQLEMQKSELARITAEATKAHKETSTVRQERDALSRDLAELQKRWDDHPIRLSNRFVTVSGWLFAVIGIMIAVFRGPCSLSTDRQHSPIPTVSPSASSVPSVRRLTP